MAGPSASLSEREWEKLTNMVLAGSVVPVTGPGLLSVDSAPGKTELLYDRWGRALAEESGMQIPDTCPIPLLYYVTNHRCQELAAHELAYEIDDVVRRQEAPIPEAVRKLAEMDCFPLYLTTTVDHQLKRALDRQRSSNGEGAHQILFSPRGAKAQVDLPDEISREIPTVFHLFGATNPVDGAFAKTEDDLIQFSWSLLDNSYAPDRLYQYLAQKTVLLVGCQFPDWLGRFLLYALHQNRPDALNMYYVGGELERGLEDFLRRRKAKILRVSEPTDFVSELHRRWAARKPANAERGPGQVAPAPMKTGSVFLSYAREDRPLVARIRAQLEAANIDTWMDETGLEPGVEFQQVIHDNIRQASFFLAFISRSLDAPDRPGRFLWKEWRWAEDVSLERRREDTFLQPICIDETAPGARFIEAPMRDLQWTRLRNGQLPAEFVSRLAQGIRRFRKQR